MFSLVEEIKKIVPSEYNPQVLAGFLDKAEEYSEDTEFVGDSGSAMEFADIIDGLLGIYREQLKGQLEIQKRLKALSVKMHWLSPGSLESDKKDLVSSNLIQAIKMGVDALSTIERWLDIFEWGLGPDDQRRSNFMYSLANNEEFIGSNNIKFSTGESSAPAVRNWIKDYLSSLPENKKLIGNFDKIHYLTNNQNAATLNDNDKNILSKIIDIYNFIKHPRENSLTSLPSQSKILQAIPQTPKPVVSISKPPVVSISKPVSVSPKPVPAAPVHGQDLDVLKKRVEQVVPGVKPPSPGLRPPSPKGGGELLMTPQELKREVSTPELATHELLEIAAPKPADNPSGPDKSGPSPLILRGDQKQAIIPPLNIRGGQGGLPKLGLKSLNSISLVDDLKKIEINHLRQSPLNQQIQLIKSKIVNLAQANRLLPYYTVNAFEQSPLFRAYLAHGQSKFAQSPPTNDLSQAEFEAIADLRKEIERL